MNGRANLMNLRKPSLRWLPVAVVPAVAFFLIAYLVLRAQGYDTGEILRDPAQQTGASTLLGFISNVGIWLWIASASIHFFTYVLATREASAEKRTLALLFGLLSLTLAADDFFMIHERYVAEHICYAIYAAISMLILVRFFFTIFRASNISFFVATGLMATSIFVDLNQERLGLASADGLRILIEDGCKFVGAALWLYFAMKMGGEVIKGDRSPEYGQWPGHGNYGRFDPFYRDAA